MPEQIIEDKTAKVVQTVADDEDKRSRPCTRRGMTESRHRQWEIALQGLTLLLATIAAVVSAVWVVATYLPEQRRHRQAVESALQQQNAELRNTLVEMQESRKTELASTLFSRQTAVYSKMLGLCEDFHRELQAAFRDKEGYDVNAKRAKLAIVAQRIEALANGEFRLYADSAAYRAVNEYIKSLSTRALVLERDAEKKRAQIKLVETRQTALVNACRASLERTSNLKIESLGAALPPPGLAPGDSE